MNDVEVVPGRLAVDQLRDELYGPAQEVAQLEPDYRAGYPARVWLRKEDGISISAILCSLTRSPVRREFARSRYRRKS